MLVQTRIDWRNAWSIAWRTAVILGAIQLALSLIFMLLGF